MDLQKLMDSTDPLPRLMDQSNKERFHLENDHFLRFYCENK